MKRSRFTEEQIIGVLKEHEAGAKTADLARKHAISEATLYNWKARFGGLQVCSPSGSPPDRNTPGFSFGEVRSKGERKVEHFRGPPFQVGRGFAVAPKFRRRAGIAGCLPKPA
jgi:putative transposase